MASCIAKEYINLTYSQTKDAKEHRNEATDQTNATDCPLCNQTGDEAIRDFTRIIDQLPSDLRAAFEAEQAARRAEIELYLAVGE